MGQEVDLISILSAFRMVLEPVGEHGGFRSSLCAVLLVL